MQNVLLQSISCQPLQYVCYFRSNLLSSGMLDLLSEEDKKQKKKQWNVNVKEKYEFMMNKFWCYWAQYDDKWLTSTMFMMNPSQHNLPHRKFTDGISMACSYPGPWDTFLTLIENFLVGEYWQVANCKSANWPVKSSSHTVQALSVDIWM